MARKLSFGYLTIWVCSLLFACSPSENQIGALSTQIAGEIYSTQTAAAKQVQPDTETSPNLPTTTPTSTLTPTKTQEIL